MSIVQGREMPEAVEVQRQQNLPPNQQPNPPSRIRQHIDVGDAGATLRVQMELRVPEHDRDLVQRMLDRQDWSGVGRYLGWKHPRHRLLIGSWLLGGRARGKDVSCSLTLLA